MCSLDGPSLSQYLLYLIRHACAGNKRQWTGPDVERPLDAAGIAQAVALADELAVLPIHRESTV